jgi:hypothetical protein
MDTRLWNAVDRRFRRSKIADAIKYLESRLAKEGTKRFKGLLERGFSNTPWDVLTSINEFIDECAQEFDIKAVYLEMNGFDINPDLWYFDSFGYSKYGADPNNLEWLCNWDSPEWPHVALEGLEAVQDDFAWYHENRIWKDESLSPAYDQAVSLVMCKFVSLIEAALTAGNRSRPIPILATAHDFDIIGRFEA